MTAKELPTATDTNTVETNKKSRKFMGVGARHAEIP
jgi:hypothetical protein